MEGQSGQSESHLWSSRIDGQFSFRSKPDLMARGVHSRVFKAKPGRSTVVVASQGIDNGRSAGVVFAFLFGGCGGGGAAGGRGGAAFF